MRAALVLFCLAACSSRLLSAADAPAPLPPEEVAQTMSLPEGFRCMVFASEPDVVQPIGMTTDDRGRLWVVECLSYPEWAPVDHAVDGSLRERNSAREASSPQGSPQDRVSIFEDTDGDGRHDVKTVFYTGRNITSVELGFGGVFILSLPELLFIPDRDRNDEPDGEPVVLLDGFSLKAKHNVANGLTWGPDGWLYGMHGILDTSFVGKPDSSEDERTALNCSVWRYHPVRQTFEVVCHGTTNPWGLDYDQYGQFFFTNCVINHLFHAIPGAHYVRMYGQDLNPHVYELMPSIADYLHWGGGPWQSSRGGEGIHDAPGGGHAHAGCMVYQGDNWPAEYRHRHYTLNIHGRRVNSDVLNHNSKGSGYDADRGPDLFKVTDPWFRGLELRTGADGAVYLSDWNDTGECHDYEDTQTQTGRIYKLVYRDPQPVQVDLAKESTRELIERQRHPNAWYGRHARRILQERAAAGEIGPEIARELWPLVPDEPDLALKLRWIWTLYLVRGGVGEALVETLLQDNEPIVRGWAIRLAVDGDSPPSASLLKDFARLAESDPSPVVRLHLASALQRLPINQRWSIAENLIAHAEDASDPNLPLMYWYGIEPLIPADPARALGLVVKSKIPLIRRHVTRRLAGLKK